MSHIDTTPDPDTLFLGGIVSEEALVLSNIYTKRQLPDILSQYHAAVLLLRSNLPDENNKRKAARDVLLQISREVRGNLGATVEAARNAEAAKDEETRGRPRTRSNEEAIKARRKVDREISEALKLEKKLSEEREGALVSPKMTEIMNVRRLKVHCA